MDNIEIQEGFVNMYTQTEFDFSPQLSKKRRSINAPPFAMTLVHKTLIQAVHRYRLLEGRQVESLFGIGTDEAEEIVQPLYQHAFLERIPRMSYTTGGPKAPAYRLGPEGAKLLAEQMGVSVNELHYWGKGDDKDRRKTEVTSFFIEHQLGLANVQIAFDQSATQNGCDFEAWRDEIEARRARNWPSVFVETHSGKERIPILPDWYFALSASFGRAYFFLEFDRSTETISRKWRRKILGYKEFVLSGEFNTHYGVNGATVPLRILTVTLTSARAQNLKAAAENYGPLEATPLFLFAPISELTSSDALTSPIWSRAGSFRREALV